MDSESCDNAEWEEKWIFQAPGISEAFWTHCKAWIPSVASAGALGRRPRPNWFLVSILSISLTHSITFLLWGTGLLGKERAPLEFFLHVVQSTWDILWFMLDKSGPVGTALVPSRPLPVRKRAVWTIIFLSKSHRAQNIKVFSTASNTSQRKEGLWGEIANHASKGCV